MFLTVTLCPVPPGFAMAPHKFPFPHGYQVNIRITIYRTIKLS